MHSSTSLTAAALLLLAAVITTAQLHDDNSFQEQPFPQRPLQNNQQQEKFNHPIEQQSEQSQLQKQQESGDILDAILANGTLSSLSDENIARFLDTEASVNSLAGCFAGPDTCFSEGAQRLVDELLALQPNTICLECQPGEEERLNEVIYQMVSGLSTRYPAQWSIIFPQIFSTIATFQARLAAQQQ